MELRRYLTLIWKWAWLLVLGMVLGGAGSYLFSKSLTPIYSASATLMVQPSSGQAWLEDLPEAAETPVIATHGGFRFGSQEYMLSEDTIGRIAAYVSRKLIDQSDVGEEVVSHAR